MGKTTYEIEEITNGAEKACIMSSKIQINFIHNRFDVMYGNDYILFHILSRKNREIGYYVPVKIIKNTAFLAIQLSYIENEALIVLIKYLFRKFLIWKVKFKFSLNNIVKSRRKSYFVVYLPTTIEDFNGKLSHNTRYNISRYTKHLEKNFKYLIKHFSKNEIFDNKIYEQYCQFKKITHNYSNTQSAIEYVQDNYITDALVMYLDDKIVSIVFLNILDDSAFLENLTYNVNYKSYSVGTILYYNAIKWLIDRNIKTFYLYDGTGEYKKRFNGTEIIAYNGTFYRYSFINLFLRFLRKLFS